MAWRIVKQPNGLFARFSEVVDDFTDMDMTREEAFNLCFEACGRKCAEEKIANAEKDLNFAGVPGDGLTRWNEAIHTINNIHGKKCAKKREKVGNG